MKRGSGLRVGEQRIVVSFQQCQDLEKGCFCNPSLNGAGLGVCLLGVRGPGTSFRHQLGGLRVRCPVALVDWDNDKD